MTFKQNRTPHFPWSPNLQNDDRLVESLDGFKDKDVVVTVKMDGEGTSLYTDHIHARSMDSMDHPSRHWVKRLWGQIRHNIPENWRIVGENMYAKHSIHYQNLPDYFLVFSIFDNTNTCLSWPHTVEYCRQLGLTTAPELTRCKWDEEYIRSIDLTEHLGDPVEGYVVRVMHSFHYDDYGKYVGKVVRKNHVRTDDHWLTQQIVPNKLRK